MRVDYQHANITAGNESTVLRFTAADGTHACILVDSGDDVDLGSLLEDDEYLNAVLLTHSHIDHYRSLARNVRHSAPIYTSKATATILEHALPEAEQDNDLGDVSVALEALEPIDEWTSILNGLEVRPVSVGHTPGGSGFVIRFDDENTGGSVPDGEQHILVTGDFTTRPCAGFPGLGTSYPFDVDCLLLNVPTNDSYSTALNESLRTVLERAYTGSRVVVAASSLTGLHYATLLGRSTAALDLDLPIRLVGQAAKLYTALDYDVPGVQPTPVFDRPDAVLERGGITIAGPETPTTGSTERLLRAIADDPAAAFVQLTAGSGNSGSDTRCTTHSFRLSNHPSLETIDDVVRSTAPRAVVVKHATGATLNRFQRRFDRCFVWGTNDADVHRLYENGTWQAPGWITESAATRIRRRRWEAVRERPLGGPTRLSTERQQSIDLEAEGVDLEALEEPFSRDISESYARAVSEPESDGQDERSLEDELLARLESIETKLDASEETVTARVLSDGRDGQFLHLLDPAAIDAGDVVEITIKSRSLEQ
ncbi:MBL fold metallo-hydrolase [Halopiger djelfimassiliensis]|uniref:MBL fold metallo-hydrolase n=1 Tax=Halopiger djelfimassiliensis TaxID=1293047 RepID=UPI0006777802|nr:MBL fold metallo-hydrolase [Halopiger djelfimassiliensis]